MFTIVVETPKVTIVKQPAALFFNSEFLLWPQIRVFFNTFNTCALFGNVTANADIFVNFVSKNI